jgi:murein DD-endopeptidase MepM/ murein hydrolase activator NlpD
MKNPQCINTALRSAARGFLIITCACNNIPSTVTQPAAQAAVSPTGGLSDRARASASRSADNSPASTPVVSPSSTAPELKFSVEPKVIERGSPCLFIVTAPEPLSSLEGSLTGKKVLFNADQSHTTWYGLAGVGLESALGIQKITLKGRTASGQAVTLTAQFEIEARKANIRVPPEFTDPDDEEKARIARDAILKRDAFKTLSSQALWNGSFLRPVDTSIRMTADFAGTRRFNRGPVKVHRGVDYGAPQGTTIKAINRGRVLLAKNMFYDGNLVVIDHGQGLLSLYLHLSKFDVKEGDLVSSGQSIGLSGSTGRSSGPHLHLQVKWEGTDIDPQELLTLKLPSNLAKSN